MNEDQRCTGTKGKKADSVYPGYGDNPHNPEDTVAIQPIPSRYIRYIADTEDTVSFGFYGSPPYLLDSMDLHRISWILWISTVSSGFSGFPWYLRIPTVSYGSGIHRGYIADPEDTVGIRGYRDTRSAFSPLTGTETLVPASI
jgi:hypothetical protein